MKFANPPRSVLDSQTASFIQLPVSINLATSNRDLKPAITRAFGCVVAPDLSMVTLFIDSQYNKTVLENIEGNGAIAVVFSQPITLQTIQLKGVDAKRVAIAEMNYAAINRYRQAMIKELQKLGYSPSFTETMIPPMAQVDIAICFTPTAAFIQTPGPQAGMRLSA